MRVPRWLLLPAMIIFALYWTQVYFKNDSEPSVFDLPKTLEEKSYTIEVYPVSNVNSVPVFTTGKGSNEEDYLYLTPASDTVEFPDNYSAKKDSGYVLQVHGRFYMGTGIPAEYLRMKPKPERYRVFQFDRATLSAEKENQ